MSSQPTADAAGTIDLGGDLTVNRMGFGAMRITGSGIWGEPPSREAAVATLRRVVELGVNFIDTADSYGPSVSEEIIAEALYPYADDLVIGTKGGNLRTGPNIWIPCGRPDYLRQQLELSLRHLKLERIDLYQLHRIDPTVPLEETLGGLKEMQDEGKIRHIGLSEVSVAEVEQARKVVDVVSVQNLYNLADRHHEAVLDYCEKENLAFIPWFPLATGKLAGSGGALDKAAEQHGLAPAQLALAWVLQRSPVMLPIPGTSKVAHLEENMKAAGVQLTADEYAALEKAV
jgi:pyridoxine 4-dehydrogenase